VRGAARSLTTKAQEIGRAAEDAAALALEREGMVILGRNLRVGRLEIDILARKGAVVAVVEVRSRAGGSWVGAFTSVDWKKRARLRAAGRALWRRHFERDPSVERMRFDVASVSFDATGVATVEIARAVF
jgi:putative endonuclease